MFEHNTYYLSDKDNGLAICYFICIKTFSEPHSSHKCSTGQTIYPLCAI